MTDQKSDDERGRPEPQVIDLTAEEIRPEESAAEPAAIETESETKAEDIRREDDFPQAEAEPAYPPPPPLSPQPAVRRRSPSPLWFIAALILGLIAGGWLYRDWLSAYFPNNQVAAMAVRLDTLEASSQALANQVAALGQPIEAATQAANAAAADARTAQSGIGDVAARIDGIDQRIAATETALATAQADLDQLRKAVSAGSGTTGGGGTVDNAALAALGQRLDALEKDVASLKTSGGSGETATVTSALSQALSDLKAKVAAGTGFAAEYDRIARMVPAAAGLDVLASAAESGLPSAPGLAQELRAAIPALPQPAAPAPEPDGYWDSLLDQLSGIVTIRDIGEANWPQLAEKSSAFAEAGDLNQAISSIDAAEGEKPMALTQWRDRAAARLRLEAALEQVADAVLRQIAALGGVK